MILNFLLWKKKSCKRKWFWKFQKILNYTYRWNSFEIEKPERHSFILNFLEVPFSILEKFQGVFTEILLRWNGSFIFLELFLENLCYLFEREFLFTRITFTFVFTFFKECYSFKTYNYNKRGRRKYRN